MTDAEKIVTLRDALRVCVSAFKELYHYPVSRSLDTIFEMEWRAAEAALEKTK